MTPMDDTDMRPSSYPLISVVTICKNSAGTIGRTLASVAACSYPRLQYVIVDGGSSDGTLEVVATFRPRVDKLVSEPDRGISDALNKAIALTDGEYHILVHADDELLPGALEGLAEAAMDCGAQVICGTVEVVSNDRIVRIFRPRPEKLRWKMSIPHMGALVRREAWSAVGGYDLRRKIAMDHLFMLKILRRFGLNGFRSVDRTVARYSLGGISDRQVMSGFRELRENLIEQGAGRVHAYQAYWTLVAKARLLRVLGRA